MVNPPVEDDGWLIRNLNQRGKKWRMMPDVSATLHLQVAQGMPNYVMEVQGVAEAMEFHELKGW